jgi:hypothetical protein
VGENEHPELHPDPVTTPGESHTMASNCGTIPIWHTGALRRLAGKPRR